MKMVMKLITALAVTALLATSADAQTRRTREVRIQQNNSLSRNSVSRNPVSLARIIHDSTSFSSPRRARAPSTSPDLIRIGV